ncbi:hypothetical protein ABT330_09430 [Streptomyces sp. NPDC000658]
MAATNDPTTITGIADALDALLWRWVEHIDRNGDQGMVRPEWFAYAGS